MKLLPLFVFWGLWFLGFSTRTAFSPILPLIEDHFGLSHGEAGSLFTSLSFGYSLSLLATGRFGARWGYKKTLVSGCIGTSLVLIGFQWVESYPVFHLLFFLLGLNGGTYLPSVIAIITATYEARFWGRVIGFHETAAGLSIFSIPLLVPMALEFISWRHVLLLLGILMVPLLILFWKVAIEPNREFGQAGIRYRDLLRRKSIWIMAFLWVLSAANSLGIYSILPLYLIKEQGIGFDLANLLFGVSRAGGIFFPLAMGLLADRYGYRNMLILTLLCNGLITVALSLAPTLPLLFVALVLQAIFSVAFFPVAFIAVSRLTSLSERSMALGIIISAGVIFGAGGAPFILGMVADRLNFKTGLCVLGILTALSSFAVHSLKEASSGEK